MNSSPILSVKDLVTRFSDNTYGLKGVSMEITSGDFLIICGQNGSGKSLFCKHLNGLLRPTKGEVFFRGKPVAQNLRTVRAAIGMVFQDAENQIVGQTVEEDIAFGPENLGKTGSELRERIESALSITGLTEHRHQHPHTLSGGEKRRLCIGGVWAMRPDVLVLDEPFANLDYPGVQRVLELIIRVHEEGKTIILVTHDLEKSLAHANRLAVFHEGRIVLDTSPEKGISQVHTWNVRTPYGKDRTLESYSWLS
ncbi:MAG: energy-coupling factor ABC transporter ATP-binding protein [Spirochaetia bacterium]